MKGIKNKNVLVTGSSSGLGRAIAIKFAEEGANVIINYHSDRNGAKKTLQAAKKFNVNVMIIQADVSKDDDIKRMFDKIESEFGGLDILINNAAIQIQKPSHEVSMDDFDKILAVNLRGYFACAQKALNHFIKNEKKGVIINISSAHEIIPKPQYIAYSVSKGGIKNLTRTLALEYARKGIRVNTVAPGALLTRMNKSWANDPIKRAAVEEHIPLGYAAEPEKISPAVAFLASDDAEYITGITLFVDGGATLYPEFQETWAS
ncbi:MAG: glucose 1-dehydrogenase [Promethearchaeota archaeon]